MSIAGRVFLVLLISSLAGCGGASVSQARAELVAIGDGRRPEDPAGALANYLEAEKLEASDAVRQRIEVQARQIADVEIEAAREQAARGELLSAVERLLRVRAGFEEWGAGAYAPLDAAIAELARPAFAAERARLEESNVVPVVQSLRRLARAAGDEELVRAAGALVAEVRDYFLGRAREAAGIPLAVDLHLRLAQSLGAEMSAEAYQILNSVEEQLLLPIRVVGAGGGCDDVLAELRDVVETGNDVARELTLVAEFSLRCSAEEQHFENDVGGVVVPFEALVLRAVGSVTLRFAGGSLTVDVDQVGASSEVQSLDYARARARDEIAKKLATSLRDAREAARDTLVERMRPALGSSDWRERDAAAVVLWGVAQDSAAVSALQAAYGVDGRMLATLYPDDGGRATLPAAVAASPPELPEPRGGEAVARLSAQRDKYGHSDPIEWESRPLDYWRPGLGVAFVIDQSPLTGAGRAHRIRLDANLLPLSFYAELERDELGGDTDGWEVGYAPRIPLSEYTFITTGVIGGRQSAVNGNSHAHFSIPVVLHRRSKYFLYGAGIELNFLQLGGTNEPPESQRFSPAFLALEAPMPVGPRLYVRLEAAHYLGSDDPWTIGVWLGARKVLARK